MRAVLLRETDGEDMSAMSNEEKLIGRIALALWLVAMDFGYIGYSYDHNVSQTIAGCAALALLVMVYFLGGK